IAAHGIDGYSDHVVLFSRFAWLAADACQGMGAREGSAKIAVLGRRTTDFSKIRTAFRIFRAANAAFSGIRSLPADPRRRPRSWLRPYADTGRSPGRKTARPARRHR